MTSAAVRAGFRDVAGHLVAVAAAIPAEAWNKPGLGEWTVRDLTGHAARALLTTEQYLAAASSGEPELHSPAEYFLMMLASLGSGDKAALNASVAQRGREAGAALGADPAAEVRAIAGRVLPKVDATSDEAIVLGKMRLIDYLPTRIFEMTVHSLDLAAALGSPDQPPPAALALTMEVAAALAIEQSRAGELLLAITGRRPLPAGYSIL